MQRVVRRWACQVIERATAGKPRPNSEAAKADLPTVLFSPFDRASEARLIQAAHGARRLPG